jgi:hypothetical protein
MEETKAKPEAKAEVKAPETKAKPEAKAEVKAPEKESGSKLKKSYTVCVTGLSFGTNKVLKGGEKVTVSKYGEAKIKQWLESRSIK